ncbi:MAG: hypothetical protein GYB64_03360 [Chloroflexi bacterium]|nr:hypothetical protein [Chloroflexota bacterium]
MRAIIAFIADAALFFYALAALGIFLALRGLSLARQQRRTAAFGLEREAAQRRQMRAVRSLVSMLLLIVVVFLIQNVAAPNLPESAASPAETPTPEPDVEQGPQEPVVTVPPILFPTITPVPGLGSGDAAEAALTSGSFEACAYPGVTITSPEPGQTVSGQVRVEGEAFVFPFFLYKFELRGEATGGSWVLLNTFNESRTGVLGSWDSTSLPRGNYTMRLVVYTGPDQVLPPCTVDITVGAPGDEAPQP